MVIVITGATSGIGEALAYSYASLGITLHLCGRRSDLLEQVAESCRKKGATVYTQVIDVSDRRAMTRWLHSLDEQTPVDMVIANAGVANGLRGRDYEPAEAVYDIFDINVTGLINTIMPLVPSMVRRQHGQIAIMSSLAGFFPIPMTASYSASKAAVRYWGIAIRGALAPHGIKVNVVCPGFVRSPMTDRNTFTMPLLMDMDKAIRLIQHGLKHNHAIVAFPFITAWMARLAGLIPARVMNLVHHRAQKR